MEMLNLYEAWNSGNPVRIQRALAARGDIVDCLHDSDTCPRGCPCICDLCE